MKITLIPSPRKPFLEIEGLDRMTFKEPGPIEVKIKEITPVQVGKIIAHYKSGFLLIEPASELDELLSLEEKRTVSQKREAFNPMDVYEKRQKLKTEAFKGILLGTIPQISTEIKEMTPSDITKLIALEKENKNRKGVLSSLDKERREKELALTKKMLKGGGGADFSLNYPSHSNVLESDNTIVEVDLATGEVK